MDESTVKSLFSLLVLPPAGPLIVALAGALLTMRRRSGNGARVLLGVGLAAAWLLSTPAVSQALIGWLEDGSPPVLTAQQLAGELRGQRPPGAIVVLGGGVRYSPQEWPSAEWPNQRTLERLAFAAPLARSSALPILVSGGTPQRRQASEAALMSQALRASFALSARWVEDRSTDTASNAAESARMLRAAGVSRIVLVTQAYHMPRAVLEFRAAGLEVIAAPHGFSGSSRIESWQDFVPGAGAVATAWLATHELAGLLWHLVRARL
ncbi:MAG: YdcF family protein [Burkholderiaceae bacterium]|nr:YdcF family protein [Burkholderiaceae bacterium]